MKAEVWAWLPRDHEGRMAATAAEVLHEAAALARRLDAALVAIADRKPDASQRALTKVWRVKQVRQLHQTPLSPAILQVPSRAFAGLEPGQPPRAFVWPASGFGAVAAPFWAALSGAVLITGAVGITADATHYVVARRVLGEQYEALETVPLEQPLVVTLQPGAVGDVSPPSSPPSSLAIKEPSPLLSGLRPPDPRKLALADAERIVAFGRGAFSPEGVALVERLAQALGAVVAGTRPAADEGWLPFARQVGLTGAVVRPRLYVAVGISGAPYHMVGVKEPQTLVAINADAEAPIFAAADLGIVGDLYQVLPRLIEDLSKEPAGSGADLSAVAQGGRRP